MAALRGRKNKVGIVDLGLEGPSEFPERQLGFAVVWHASPADVRRAVRRRHVAGVVVECESPSVDSAAAVVRAVEREDKKLAVWIAMSSGHSVLVSRVVSVFRLDQVAATDIQVLTPRELEVLTLIRQGFTNQAIASHLGISLSSVKRHVEHVLLKLAVKNRAQAAGRLRRQSG